MSAARRHTRALTIAAPRELVRAAVARAAADDVSVATLARRALRQAAEAHGVVLAGPVVADRSSRGATCQARQHAYLPLNVPVRWIEAIEARGDRFADVVRRAVADYLGFDAMPDGRRMPHSQRRYTPAPPPVSRAVRNLAKRHADSLGAVGGRALAHLGLSSESRRHIAARVGRSRGWSPWRVSTLQGGAWVVWAPSQAAAEEYADCVLRPARRAA